MEPNKVPETRATGFPTWAQTHLCTLSLESFSETVRIAALVLHDAQPITGLLKVERFFVSRRQVVEKFDQVVNMIVGFHAAFGEQNPRHTWLEPLAPTQT